MQSETKKCQNCKKDFTIESEDFAFYERIDVPAPTFCPSCRLQRRLAWRNMRSIYKRKCKLCSKNTISIYSADKPYIVYCSKCWWGDGWDELESGREYDEKRSFLDQLNELLLTTPLVARFGLEQTAKNSNYVNMFAHIKDCYLCFHVDNSERCLYSYYVESLTDCNALAFSYSDELCYHSFGIQKCNRVMYSKYSESCLNSWFLKNCVGCTDCFASSNLRNKKYYIFNKPHGNKEAYEAKLKELEFYPTSYKSVQYFKQQAETHWIKYPSKCIHGIKNMNVTGDLVNNSKNTQHAFSVRDGENLKYVMFLITGGGKDSMDWTQYGEKGELIYEAMASGGASSNCHFGVSYWKGSRDCEYNYFAINSSDCFGNVSIRNKQYCILNKQYSKEGYEFLKKKIIEKMKTDGEYGEFFPIKMSLFGYNETTASEEFSLTQRQALEKDYKWTDIEAQKGKYTATMKATEIPDDIVDAKDNISKEVISCIKCAKIYQVVATELQFHKKLLLPLPRLCIDCRYNELMNWKNEFKLYRRKCQCAGRYSSDAHYENVSTVHQPHNPDDPCPNEFETTYSPEQKEIVYCEKCYQEEVY